MGIAITLAQYLAERGVKYDVMKHPHTVTASESARRAVYRSIAWPRRWC